MELSGARNAKSQCLTGNVNVGLPYAGVLLDIQEEHPNAKSQRMTGDVNVDSSHSGVTLLLRTDCVLIMAEY